MKKSAAFPSASCLVLLAFTAIGFGSFASGALIAYDDFEGYPSGGNLNGGSAGTGWASNWSTVSGHVTVQGQVITDPGGNVSAGAQAARLQPTTDLGDVSNFMSRGFASTSDTLYAAMLIRPESGVDGGDFYNFQASDGATGNSTSALGFGIRNNPGNSLFARVGSSGSGQTTNSSTNATLQTDFLLVAKFSKDGSATYNRTDLFINPAGLSEPATADATAISGVTGLSDLSLFSLRNFTPEAGDTVFIDELRLATTFEDALGGGAVIPEPSRALLLLGGIAVMALRRRHRS